MLCILRLMSTWTSTTLFTLTFYCQLRKVEEDFRNGGIEFGEELGEIERWFSEVVYQESDWKKVEKEVEVEASIGIGLPATIPFIARLLAKMTGWIKTGDEIKTEIRHKMDRQVSQLLDQINILLRQALIQVRQAGKQGVAVLMDGLDRMTFKELGPGRTSYDALFIEHSEQLRALDCHTVYTVPISMMYSTRATMLRGIFPDSRVLPMIKISEPRVNGGGDVPEGIDRLRGILAHRVDLDSLAEPDAVTYLCRASGGHPRDLLTLVRQSIEYAVEASTRPISVAAAERAEARLVAAFSRMIPEDDFSRLARVYQTNEVVNDAAHQAMLFNLSVLEYANGIEPWHDVHPAVQKIARFKRALEDERPKLKP
jgi:hypothetical protein